jgi:N-methylhydantoinase B/oxoprolinase/acetone carboxylase alpha subunit
MFIINSFIEDYLQPTRQDGSPGCDTSEHPGTGARPHRGVVEGEDHHRGARDDPTEHNDGRYPVYIRHFDIHQNHSGAQGSRQRYRLGGVARLAYHLQVRL